MRRELLIAFALAALTLGVYWPVRTHDFILYDDPQFVTQNPQIQSGLTLQTISYALHTPVAGNWHPVTTLSHALDCELFGLDAGAHHFVSVVLHTATALLLLFLLKDMTGALWFSALVAGLFALHPLRVESVAWIAERKDVLSGLFFMLTLLAYTKYVRAEPQGAGVQGNNPRPHAVCNPQFWYALSLFLFALGLMSKPMLVTTPFVLLLLDCWPLQRFSPSKLKPQIPTLLREKLPFFALSALCCWCTLRIQATEHFVRTAGNIDLKARVSNAVVSYYQYLAKAVWPTQLAVLYPHPALHYPVRDVWPTWQIGTIALLLLAVSGLCVLQFRRRPWLAVGWFWYLGMLVPVIGLVQVGAQAMADRYTYLPLIGPVLSLVWECGRLCTPSKTRTVVVATPALFTLITCVVLTHHQLGYWRNTVTLMEHTTKVTPDNPFAHNNLACALLEAHPAQAAVHFRVASAIEPDLPQAHYALGELLKAGDYWQAAAEQFLAVTRVATNGYPAHLGLVEVLPHLARNKEAIFHMNEVLRLQSAPPPQVLNDLAWTLATSPDANTRDGLAAIHFAERASELTHYTNALMVGTLAAAYAEGGKFQQATNAAEKAIAAAEAFNLPELANINRQLLELYRVGKPYRETNTAVSH